MARKMFLSILGTNLYEECSYFWKDKSNNSRQRFVQKACVDLFCNTWDSIDKIVIFSTKKAKKVNWDKAITSRKDRSGNEIPYMGLENLLSNSIIKEIPEGKDKEEIWRIFEIIYNQLEEEDEVYLDITHSFRYLPMLLLSLLNYAKYLKKITIKQITYGNYEAMDNDGYAPIVNLTVFSELQDWTIAANDFVKFGQVAKISELTQKTITPVLRNSGNKNKAAFLLNDINKQLETFTWNILTCRVKNIIENKSVDKTNQLLNKLENEIIKPLNPILDLVSNRIKDFKTNDVLNGIAAVDWCLKNGLIQQGITILQDTAINCVCLELKVNRNDREKREVVSSGFTLLLRKKEKENWNKTCMDNKELIEKMRKSYLVNSIKDWYSKISAIRNDINHSGMLDNSKKNGKSFQSNLEERLIELKEIIDNAD